MIVEMAPYWDNIVDYYWGNLEPAVDGSIWEFLERDYHGKKRTLSAALGKPDFGAAKWALEFEREEDVTIFMLRWL